MKRIALICLPLFFVLHVFAQPCTQSVIASFSPSPACSGRPLTLSASAISGASYSWTGPASTTASTQNFTITTPYVNQSGDYIVTATVGSCVYKDTVTVNMELTAFTPLASTNQPLCIGDTLKLDAFWNLTIGMSVFWWGPNNYLDTTSYGLSVRPNIQATDTGMYYVAIKHTSSLRCFSDTVAVHVDSISPMPSPPVVTSRTSFCAGNSTKQITWASPTPGVSYYSYFYIGTVKNTTTSQSFIIVGPHVSTSGWLHMSATLKGCTATDSTYIYFKPTKSPVVFISANPDTNIIANQTVVFLDSVANTGPTPTNYMWTINKAIATSGQSDPIPTLTNSSLQDGDQVCLWVKVDSTCASIDTAISCVNMHVTPVNVSAIEQNNFVIYPNPSNGAFSITSSNSGRVEIINALGQIVYSGNIHKGRNEIEPGSKFSNGIYIVSLRSGSEVQTSQLVIQR
jgi:hypothetical protein